MAVVWVVCKPKTGVNTGVTYDISPATEYGEIKFIYDAYFNPSSFPLEAIEMARTALQSFDEENDHLVWAGGDPLAGILVGYVMCELGLPLRYLRFERLRQRPPIPGQTPDPANLASQKAGYYIPVIMPNSAY